jgi:hypothetical protein
VLFTAAGTHYCSKALIQVVVVTIRSISQIALQQLVAVSAIQKTG